jgi:glucan biosynthesis protein C
LSTAILQWLCIAGLLGLAVRWRWPLHKMTRSLCDASYWIYIIHIPVVIFSQGLLVHTAWPVGLKFICVTLATTCLCWSSWWFVKPTPLGALLGRPALQKRPAHHNP